MHFLRAFPVLAVLSLALAGCGFSDMSFWKSPQPSAAAAAPPPPDDAKAAAPPAKAMPPAAASAAQPSADAPPDERRRPFVMIRFERPNPDYAPALYDALSGALKRRPDVSFDLVAVTRNPDAAQRNLASVLRSVTAMGLPADRLSLAVASAGDDTTDEVWIYVR